MTIVNQANQKQKIKVLLVEDSPTVTSSIKTYFSRLNDIEIIGCAGTVDDALEIMQRRYPDVILLDLIMPGADGFCMLEQFHKNGVNIPNIIVLSAIGEEEIIKRALAYGAKYYMVKPVKNEVLHQRILDLYDLGEQIFTSSSPEIAKTKSIDEKITSIFLAIGIPAHIKGYQFLREAIKMVVDQPDTINYITKALYPGIASRFDTSASKVERAIRHAIEVAWTRGKVENMNSIFGYNIYSKLEKPTNGEFIALVADKLIMEKGA